MLGLILVPQPRVVFLEDEPDKRYIFRPKTAVGVIWVDDEGFGQDQTGGFVITVSRAPTPG